MTSLKVVIHFQWTLKSFLSIASINSSIISDSTSDLLFWDIKTGITFDLLRGEQAHCISEIASLFVKYTHGCHDGAKNIFESSVMHQTLRSFICGKVMNKNSIQAVSISERACVQFLLILWNNICFELFSSCRNYFRCLCIKLISTLSFPCVFCSYFWIYRAFQRNYLLIEQIDFFV